MGVFEFEGVREGKRLKGTVEAGTRSEALSKLKGEGIVPLSLKERKERPLLRGRVSEEEVALLLTQLEVLLRAGVPLTEALDLLSRQVRSERISTALSRIKAEVERGEPVSTAFKRAGIFPEFLPEMLTVAETGENLELVFGMAAEHMRTVADMKGRILNAVAYPSVVIAMSFVALFIAVTFVVPRVASVLEGMGRELPLATEVVLLISEIFSFFIYAVPFILLLFLLFGRKLIRRDMVEAFLLRVPFIGGVLLSFDLSRFAYTLHMTLSSSVPVVTAFRSATASMSLKTLKDKLESLTDEIERGRSLSWVLRRAGFFPDLFISLVETGEGSGELERMLKVLGDLYRREALSSVNRWVRLIEPVSILLVGILIGLIALSVLLPLTEVTTGLGR